MQPFIFSTTQVTLNFCPGQYGNEMIWDSLTAKHVKMSRKIEPAFFFLMFHFTWETPKVRQSLWTPNDNGRANKVLGKSLRTPVTVTHPKSGQTPCIQDGRWNVDTSGELGSTGGGTRGLKRSLFGIHWLRCGTKVSVSVTKWRSLFARD